MKTKEILTIIAISSLGLCLLCSLAKMTMRNSDKGKKHCGNACGAFVLLAVILLTVSQLLREEERYGDSSKRLCKNGEKCVGRGENSGCNRINGLFYTQCKTDSTSTPPYDFSNVTKYKCKINNKEGNNKVNNKEGITCKDDSGKNTIAVANANNISGTMCDKSSYMCSVTTNAGTTMAKCTPKLNT